MLGGCIYKSVVAKLFTLLKELKIIFANSSLNMYHIKATEMKVVDFNVTYILHRVFRVGITFWVLTYG
jgi:hypothetical protein